MNNAPARHFRIIFCTFSVFAYLYAKNNPTPPIIVDITIYRICSNPKSCGATITSKIEKFFFFATSGIISHQLKNSNDKQPK